MPDDIPEGKKCFYCVLSITKEVMYYRNIGVQTDSKSRCGNQCSEETVQNEAM